MHTLRKTIRTIAMMTTVLAGAAPLSGWMTVAMTQGGM